MFSTTVAYKNALHNSNVATTEKKAGVVNFLLAH